MTEPVNALTVDVEDWRQLVYGKLTGRTMPPAPEVVRETEDVMDLLEGRGVKATFFVLANVVTAYPALIRQIDARGHEVASHGFSHRRIYLQSPAEFLEETRRAKALLEDAVGKPVLGYRAAEFSITRRSLWALDLLAEAGFVYDSSIFPIDGQRYGIPDFPLDAGALRTPGGQTIMEFPLTAIEAWGRRWPIGGGGYFRFMPYRLTRAVLRRTNRTGRLAVVYLHPYDLARTRLRAPHAPLTARRGMILLRHSAVHNVGRARFRRRFTTLLTDFPFRPLRELLAGVPDVQRAV